MIISRPLNPREPDLLKGHESCDVWLTFDPWAHVELGGGAISIKVEAPSAGWTHDALEQLPPQEVIDRMNAHGYVWDAYLGGHWIGSSEV